MRTQKEEFLKTYIDSYYEIEPIAQDASSRQYYRIKTPNTTYMLMDCPPEHYSTKPFEKVSEWLLAQNFSAPQIFHKDTENGFLLLEDFGDTTLQLILKSNPKKYYMCTMDLLIALHKITPPSWLQLYSKEMMLKELEIFTDYYLDISADAKKEYLELWSKALDIVPNLQNTVILRDYHVQNLMYIEKRNGINSLGILDFQDAVIGSPIYDIVSILEDAREEVNFNFADEMLKYYLSQTKNISEEEAKLSYDLLGAQRNLRILGVFARKQVRDGSDAYLKFIPRVEAYVKRDLQNPALAEIKEWHQIHSNNK